MQIQFTCEYVLASMFLLNPLIMIINHITLEMQQFNGSILVSADINVVDRLVIHK